MSHDLIPVLGAYMTENARKRASQKWLEIEQFLAICVGQHHGGVVSVTSEGWFLATFEDALAAMNCAIKIQRQLLAKEVDAGVEGPPLLHIGLNIEIPPNDGVIWPPGKDDRVDRLVALAEPGGICLSRTIYSDIRFKIDLPFDTTRDPKHTVFQCVEIRQKLNTLNLLEAGAVRIGAAALAGHIGRTAVRGTTSGKEAGVIGRVWAYIDRNLFPPR